jgi:DNA-binding IclR family transcriptional regulator
MALRERVMDILNALGAETKPIYIHFASRIIANRLGIEPTRAYSFIRRLIEDGGVRVADYSNSYIQTTE